MMTTISMRTAGSTSNASISDCQPCVICQKLTLDAISKAANCRMRGGYSYPEELDDSAALISGTRLPIQLDLRHIRLMESHCPICALISRQIDKSLDYKGNLLEVYQCQDRHGKLDSFWVYTLDSDMLLAMVRMYADKGRRLLLR
jgi:hypothetical protein